MAQAAQYVPTFPYGTRVRFQRKERFPFNSAPLSGEGVFTLHWLGMEECWKVKMDDGTEVGLFPCFGDEMVEGKS